MAQRKRLARQFIIEVESAVANTWVGIGGINTFGWERSKDNADTTEFDSDGWGEHLPANRGMTLSASGFFREEDTTAVGPPATTIGDRDPGQLRVETLAEAIGTAGVGRIRITTPAGMKRILEGSFNTSGPGGGTNDPAAFSMDFELSGPPAAWAAA